MMATKHIASFLGGPIWAAKIFTAFGYESFFVPNWVPILVVRNDLFSEITHPDRAADAPGYGDTPHPAGIPFGLVGVGGGEELLYVCFM